MDEGLLKRLIKHIFAMSITTTNIEVIRFVRDQISDASNMPQSTAVFSDRLVYESLRSSRAALLQRKIIEKEPINHENYQTISCIPLREVDVVECPCAPRSGCTFRVTEWDLPTPLGKLHSVSSIDGSINYSYVEWDKFNRKINGRRAHTSNSAYFTTKNTKRGIRLYLYNDIHKEMVSVTSVFADPIKIYNYPNCDGSVEECIDYLQLPFPVDPDLLGTIYEASFDLLRQRAPTEDKLQNESDDARSQTPIV